MQAFGVIQNRPKIETDYIPKKPKIDKRIESEKRPEAPKAIEQLPIPSD